MSEDRTAEARIRRLLHVLPAASRAGGASLAELARALEASEEQILADIEDVTARAYYHPGGWPDDVQILVQADRVQVLRAAGFDRPVKLSAPETLCLALALRGTAATAALADGSERLALLQRAEAHLAADAGQAWADGALHAPERAPDPEGIRELLIGAVRERRPCAIHYVKAGADDGSVRIVHPYAVAYAEGHWYAVARCTMEDGIRAFRIDRILAADTTEDRFEAPVDFRIDDYMTEGRVFRADSDRPLRVRYSAGVARWIRERAEWRQDPLEELEDGSVVGNHRAADPWWAVGHALTYGAEAEILEPLDVRRLVRRVAKDLAASLD